MRLLFISDLHGQCDALPTLPAADAILVGGDFTQFGSVQDANDVLAAIRNRPEPCLAVLGNLDPPEANAVLEAADVSLQLRLRQLNHLSLGGIGGANDTPFQTPYEWSDNAMAETLATRFPTGTGMDILVSHAPPLNSGADRIGNGMNVGSRAVAELVQRLQPKLVLCGHIHEAAGVYSCAGAIVVNPGPFGPKGHYAYIDWPDSQQAPAVWLAQTH